MELHSSDIGKLISSENEKSILKLSTLEMDLDHNLDDKYSPF